MQLTQQLPRLRVQRHKLSPHLRVRQVDHARIDVEILPLETRTLPKIVMYTITIRLTPTVPRSTIIILSQTNTRAATAPRFFLDDSISRGTLRVRSLFPVRLRALNLTGFPPF